jgi:hypothetical protein
MPAAAAGTAWLAMAVPCALGAIPSGIDGSLFTDGSMGLKIGLQRPRPGVWRLQERLNRCSR